LCRLEAVPGPDRHSPGGDLVRFQFVEPPLAEGGDAVREQPAQLLECDRRGLVLGEILLDELGERQHSPVALPATEPFQCPLERRPRILLAWKAAALDPLRGAPAGAVAVRPQWLPVAGPRVELEDLTLLQHP
jgi:hypothetical protein